MRTGQRERRTFQSPTASRCEAAEERYIDEEIGLNIWVEQRTREWSKGYREHMNRSGRKSKTLYHHIIKARSLRRGEQTAQGEDVSGWIWHLARTVWGREWGLFTLLSPSTCSVLFWCLHQNWTERQYRAHPSLRLWYIGECQARFLGFQKNQAALR